MGLIDKLRGWLPRWAPPGGSLGLGSWLAGFGPGKGYVALAGAKYDNSVVGPGLSWLSNQLQYSLPCVQKPDGADARGRAVWSEVPGHPVAAALEAGFPPNYEWSALVPSMALSWWVDGNVYLMPLFSGLGALVGLAWIPNSWICPASNFGNKDGTKFLTHYVYTPPGHAESFLSPEMVIHLRRGIDPANPLVGLSPLLSTLREIAAENSASVLSSALLENFGIAGLLFTPKNQETSELTPEKMEALRQRWRQNTRGDMAGTPTAFSVPVDVVQVGATLDKMIPAQVREANASRICAALGIDPMVLGLPSASKTYSNYEQATDAAYKGTIAPTLMVWGRQLTLAIKRLDPSFAGFRVWFDDTGIPARADDTAALWKQAGEGYKDGLITLNEGRAVIGYPSDPAGDVFAVPQQSKQDAQAKALMARLRSRTRGLDDDPAEA